MARARHLPALALPLELGQLQVLEWTQLIQLVMLKAKLPSKDQYLPYWQVLKLALALCLPAVEITPDSETQTVPTTDLAELAVVPGAGS